MRVFISHSSKDKLAVEVLSRVLRERGVEVWLDKWMAVRHQACNDAIGEKLP